MKKTFFINLHFFVYGRNIHSSYPFHRYEQSPSSSHSCALFVAMVSMVSEVGVVSEVGMVGVVCKVSVVSIMSVV